MVWFRIGVGHQKNADPKWLLPLICRRGHVTKNEIGAIKIMERESRFEIVAEAAERFATALRRSDDEDIRIEPADHGDIPRGNDGKPPRRDGKRPPTRRAGFKPRQNRAS
jgi:ATP-dependent RNA helicase DeaD